MKGSILNILMVIAVAGGLLSCNGNGPVDETVEYSFLFTENPVMVGADGGTAATVIISDIGFVTESLADWISDVESDDKETVSFKVAPNQTDHTRDGKIAFHIEGTDDVKELTIRQMASEKGLEAGTGSITFETSGGEQDVTVSSQATWDVASAPDWIVASKKNASALTVSADVNYTGSSRSGEIVIGTASESVTIEVTQQHDNALFSGAKTPMGRRFAYNTGDLVTAVTTDNSYSLADGVDVLEIKYTSKTSGTVQPYYVYIFEVDLNSGFTVCATSKDDDDAEIKPTDVELTGVQTVRDQLSSLQSTRNLDVLGGVNGDFFYGEGSATDRNNLLQGVMHKRGVCLKDSFDGGSVCTVFAVMNDGTARIMTQAVYKSNKQDIREAVGGRQEVLSSGVVTSVKNNKYDPRTAVGVSADRKKVIMAVVDGRRSSHSNGAEYSDLGKMLKAMGAYNGINLDGGGSSTFAVKDNSGFIVRNKPSNDVERKVVNGLAIIADTTNNN